MERNMKKTLTLIMAVTIVAIAVPAMAYTESELIDPVGDMHGPNYPSWADIVSAKAIHMRGEMCRFEIRVAADLPADPNIGFAFCWGLDLDKQYSYPYGHGAGDLETELHVRIFYDNYAKAYFATLDYIDPAARGEIISWEIVSRGANITVKIEDVEAHSGFYWEAGIPWTPGVTDLVPNSGRGELNIVTERLEMCNFFLTPKKLNVERNAEHSFMIHLRPCEPMDVSKGNSAKVYVDTDASGDFDNDERYPAVVNSPSMVIKVYCPDLVDNDPKVVIYSVNNIPISDTLGNDIVMYLDTFIPKGKGPKSLAATSPNQFALSQNYPNPFNPTCEISYALPTDCQVTLIIYNLIGQKVRVLVDEYQDAGHKSVRWDGTDDQGREVTSGVYFYRIQAADFEDTKKMILVK